MELYDFLALVYLSRQKTQPTDESQPVNDELNDRVELPLAA